MNFSTDLTPLRRRIGALLKIGALMALGLNLSGCVIGAIAAGGAAATTGVLVAQDRTVGEGVDDITTDANLQKRLLYDAGPEMRRVDVKVSEGRVLLTGVVKAPEHKLEASRIAWATKNVVEVVNEIEVTDRKEIKHLAGDALITSRVRTALVADRGVKSVNYGVETVNGTVYLFGRARSDGELENATWRARTIPGVKKVVNYVKVLDDAQQTASVRAGANYADRSVEVRQLN